jgi:DNA polymerase-4
MGPGFVEALPVGRFHSVGPATSARMNRLGIHTGLDLRAQTMGFLQQHFGKAGPYYYWIARGIDERPVRPDRIRKSVGAETTFATDLGTLEAADAALQPLIEKVWRYCEAAGIRGRTVTLKVKYADFSQATRSRTGLGPFASRGEIVQVSRALLEPLFPVPRGIRLLGVTLSTLNEGPAEAEAQLRLSV